MSKFEFCPLHSNRVRLTNDHCKFCNHKHEYVLSRMSLPGPSMRIYEEQKTVGGYILRLGETFAHENNTIVWEFEPNQYREAKKPEHPDINYKGHSLIRC